MNLAGPVRRIGLTGGIGSGKSTVGARLQALGAELIDADAISRASTAAGGAAISAVLERFGPDFIDSDGALNRARMRERVFADPSARHSLEAIVHPIVAREIARRVAQSNKLCIVFDVPLLAESPRWRPQLDRVVVVDCSEATQRRRVRARSAWDDNVIDGVLRSQSSRAQRLAVADVVIFNDEDDLDRLHRLVDRLSTSFGL
ncbi:MAG: dephospho-CoA kinase [Hydrogenophaga sp.]|uniref:dephospho-CoA kinase n=1 Tax=Hydrogenophaga sp. TaxID=1904254 RepID=UPI0016AF8CE3|nr:dephospho-CoA kinase [Hydrogenophaga sp.]NIM42541.1 dephospho-CoA kinase [Hydrogenophaga sp.]NIN27692.1 dephospho-CoA kinase [Hydrogenophaga sp.]NIN32512.1 dephospho-CoA kinase [Hydrogenophaga sp.]NIN56963.1 dephospho-CoA kinase [Hydrogenophaga sp.]NIO53108.1 dephospho-CoA kinase [Hydrogenophaga sp.]